jgi:hypothetical protein
MTAAVQLDPDIPPEVLKAFQGRAGISLPALAAALEWDIKTLRGHCEAGNLNWRQKGLGTTRHHRVITLADFREFWKRITIRGVACPSTVLSGRHTGTSTSRSRVIAFPGRPSVGQSGKPKKSRKRSVGRPSALLSKSGKLSDNQ